MRTEDRLLLSLIAEPESVAAVRHAVAGRAETLGMAEARIADLETVVSEACANVVLHAYEGREMPGPLEVELVPGESELGVVVRDFGVGICPSTSLDRPSLQLGLGLIGALSSRFHLVSARGEGTEIKIEIPLAAA